MKLKILIDPSNQTNSEVKVGTEHDCIKCMGGSMYICDSSGTMWTLFPNSFEIVAETQKKDLNFKAKTLVDFIGGAPKRITVDFFEKPMEGGV